MTKHRPAARVICLDAADRVLLMHWRDPSDGHLLWEPPGGGIEPGEKHYYRIHGPTVLVEYDDTQNGANHIHTVWRDFDGDFGRDLLREHYRSASHSHGH